MSDQKSDKADADLDFLDDKENEESLDELCQEMAHKLSPETAKQNISHAQLADEQFEGAVQDVVHAPEGLLDAVFGADSATKELKENNVSNDTDENNQCESLCDNEVVHPPEQLPDDVFDGDSALEELQKNNVNNDRDENCQCESSEGLPIPDDELGGDSVLEERMTNNVNSVADEHDQCQSESPRGNSHTHQKH